MTNLFGAEFRRLEDREFQGKLAFVMIATRDYSTTVDDLWEAITTPERIVRWLGPVEGEFKEGGRYAIEGNASGTISRCEPPKILDLTWEFGGATSWVNVRLEPSDEATRLTLEHIAHVDGPGAEHFEKYGPGAGGVGWDLALHGLANHLSDPTAELDPEEVAAWWGSEEARELINGSARAWEKAHVEYGEDAETAGDMADRTIAFYTGG
jgi:uncharacterized protein YndB with AHSA1/START domain